MSSSIQGFSSIGKIRLAFRIWILFFDIQLRLRRYPLPVVVDQLSRSVPARPPPITPRRLGIIVYRVLHVGPFRARCLLTSLVLFRLMIKQGDAPHLVIGMPHTPTSVDAHSWIEYRGRDVGPPPGRGVQLELVRYPDPNRPVTPSDN